MPLNEIPKYLNPETRRLIDAALEDAWQELNKDRFDDVHRARMKLATTIVALASVGETDPAKLKCFAIHALRAALKADSAKMASLPKLESQRERVAQHVLTVHSCRRAFTALFAGVRGDLGRVGLDCWRLT
jgi:hypothetical protein